MDLPMYTPNAIGLPVNLCSSMTRERTEAINYYKRAIDVAASLEIPKMLVVADHPGFGIDLAEVWKYFSDEINELANYANEKNIIISIEPLTPMESPVITRTDDCLKLIREINSPNLHFVLDIVPPTIVNEPISNYFTKLGKLVDHVHISNSDKKTDAHLELDNGCLNIKDILQILKNYEYDQYVIIELYSVSLNDPELVVANAARVLSDINKSQQ
jgi:protein FrlC